MVVKGDPNTFQWTNVQQQYFATIAVNIISLAHGCITGWVSPALPKLLSDSTPLKTGPLNHEQVSWVGSINCVGALIGSLSCGYLTTRLGAKKALLLLTIPIAAFWLLIYFGNTYYHILIARLLGGWAATGVQGGAIIFVAEIANDEIRGQLSAISPFLRNIGTLIGFALGASVSYEHIPCICIIFPIIFSIIFLFIPNSPRYLLKIGQIENAEKALKYYKGYQGNDEEEYNAFCKEFEKLKAITNVQNENQLQFADFCNRCALKGLGIGCALIMFSQFTASTAISSYAVIIFKKLGSSINPYMSSILLAVSLTFGSLVTTHLADKLGRKKLNLISLLCSAHGLFITAIYHYLNINGFNLSKSFGWIPIISLCFVIFVSSAGVIPLSLICGLESLPAKIRTIGVAIICCAFSLSAFLSVKTYPILVELIDLHICFTIYGVGCIVGFFFVLFVLKETSGQSLDDIGVEKKEK